MNKPDSLESCTDKELRQRVKLYGNLLGNVLRAHAGEGLYTAVETLRTGYLMLREREDPDIRQRLM
ncbi:MAG: hypothetical protein M3120_11225, partial [Pseudomonadota bacterium]|nr:hypothetical protein [Pseudomonadota bacterium]